MNRPGGEGEAIVIRRRIPASRQEVFHAWTDGDGMKAWMCPGDIASADVQLDPRVGGGLRVLMHGPNGSYEHWGEFIAVERSSKLAFTWCAKVTDFLPTLVTVEFLDAPDDQCDLVLTHERLPRSEARDQYRGGWVQIVTRLESFLRDRQSA